MGRLTVAGFVLTAPTLVALAGTAPPRHWTATSPTMAGANSPCQTQDDSVPGPAYAYLLPKYTVVRSGQESHPEDPVWEFKDSLSVHLEGAGAVVVCASRSADELGCPDCDVLKVTERVRESGDTVQRTVELRIIFGDPLDSLARMHDEVKKYHCGSTRLEKCRASAFKSLATSTATHNDKHHPPREGGSR